MKELLKDLRILAGYLICEKDGKHLIIQCKCWSKDKVIREKYIMQLFGSTIL